jgi:hypothetical protein
MQKAISRILCLCVVSGFLAGAEIYKWVDEEGVTHYTDRPPEDEQATGIEIPQSAPADPAAAEAAASGATPDPATGLWYEQWLAKQSERKAVEKQQRELESARRQADQADLQTRCSIARQRLAILKTQCPVFFDGQGVLRVLCPRQATWAYEGEPRYISDDERASMIRHYEQELHGCNGQGR